MVRWKVTSPIRNPEGVDQVTESDLIIGHPPDLASWSNGNIQRALGDVDADEDEGLGD